MHPRLFLFLFKSDRANNLQYSALALATIKTFISAGSGVSVGDVTITLDSAEAAYL
jgi:hypothetical protein